MVLLFNYYLNLENDVIVIIIRSTRKLKWSKIEWSKNLSKINLHFVKNIILSLTSCHTFWGLMKIGQLHSKAKTTNEIRLRQQFPKTKITL